jgi:hypothetical protein
MMQRSKLVMSLGEFKAMLSSSAGRNEAAVDPVFDTAKWFFLLQSRLVCPREDQANFKVDR